MDDSFQMGRLRSTMESVRFRTPAKLNDQICESEKDHIGRFVLGSFFYKKAG
jgi:hypothetical protein